MRPFPSIHQVSTNIQYFQLLQMTVRQQPWSIKITFNRLRYLIEKSPSALDSLCQSRLQMSKVFPFEFKKTSSPAVPGPAPAQGTRTRTWPMVTQNRTLGCKWPGQAYSAYFLHIFCIFVLHLEHFFSHFLHVIVTAPGPSRPGAGSCDDHMHICYVEVYVMPYFVHI